jgi:hypothetical protein
MAADDGAAVVVRSSDCWRGRRCSDWLLPELQCIGCDEQRCGCECVHCSCSLQRAAVYSVVGVACWKIKAIGSVYN